MTRIAVWQGLPIVAADLRHEGRCTRLTRALVDTGSAGTVVHVKRPAEVGVVERPGDEVCRVHGVGGSEPVFARKVDALSLGELSVSEFEIDVGATKYSIELDAIIGFDFLTQVGAVIDLSKLEIRADNTLPGH